MRHNMASAKKWNRKNFPSAIERYGEDSYETAKVLRRAPQAALSLLRRRPGIVIGASLVTLGALGLLWYFSQED